MILGAQNSATTGTLGSRSTDDTWFDDRPLQADWIVGDESTYEEAQSSALTVSPDSDDDAGSVMVEVGPGAQRPRVRLAPDPEGSSRWSTIRSADRAPRTSLQRERGGNTIVVTGTMAAGAPPFRPWQSLVDVELANAGWVEWFNNQRLHSAIGDTPSSEYEAIYYAQYQPNVAPVVTQ